MMIIRRKPLGISSGSAIFILLSGCYFDSSLAAYCSLRDPTVAIQTLYPESNEYRSIVRAVDKRVRERVGEILPFTIHYNEIGEHTLYQILIDGEPGGFIQARTEQSRWGLIEIAWAITPELGIDNFAFQRCRSPACSEEFRRQLLSQIKGMHFHELRQLITVDGRDLSDQAKATFPDHKKLHLSILRSALKTLAVTELVWTDVIYYTTPENTALGERQSN